MFQFIEHVFRERSNADNPSAEPDHTGVSEHWFETREAAEKYVSDHVKNTFEHSGKNEEYGYWWGRNQNGEMHRFVIISAERRRDRVAGVPYRISAMKIVLLASALAFASVSLSPAFADSIVTAIEKSVHLSDRTILVISEAQIARFKMALKLTPAQEKLWAPIEAELREIKRTDQRSEGAEGFVQRIRSRLRAIALDVAARRRLGYIARPLLISLDDEQKQRGLQVARTMGMPSLASVF